jgi:hypothetical protein
MMTLARPVWEMTMSLCRVARLVRRRLMVPPTAQMLVLALVQTVPMWRLGLPRERKVLTQPTEHLVPMLERRALVHTLSPVLKEIHQMPYPHFKLPLLGSSGLLFSLQDGGELPSICSICTTSSYLTPTLQCKSMA